MKKDDRYHGRISKGVKTQWEEAAVEGGFPSLASFIEDTVNARVAGVALQATEQPLEVQGIPVVVDADMPVGRIELRVADVTGDTIKLEKQLTVPGSDKRECANARFHRKGTFCKVCKKVITK